MTDGSPIHRLRCPRNRQFQEPKLPVRSRFKCVVTQRARNTRGEGAIGDFILRAAGRDDYL